MPETSRMSVCDSLRKLWPSSSTPLPLPSPSPSLSKSLLKSKVKACGIFKSWSRDCPEIFVFNKVFINVGKKFCMNSEIKVTYKIYHELLVPSLDEILPRCIDMIVKYGTKYIIPTPDFQSRENFRDTNTNS